MQDARGVAVKLTEAGKDMCEHGAAAAHALRQHGEHPALEFHQGRQPGAPAGGLVPPLTVVRKQPLPSYLMQYSGGIVVAVPQPSAHSQSDGRGCERGHNRDLD